MDKKVLIIDRKGSELVRSISLLPGMEAVISEDGEFPEESCDCVIVSQEYAEDKINDVFRKAWEKLMPAAIATKDGSYVNQADLCAAGADDVFVFPMYGKLLRKRLTELIENTVISGFSSFDSMASENKELGAFIVQEKEFRNIYKFVLRLLERLDKKAQLIEFELKSHGRNIIEPDIMNDFATVVQRSLRRGDISCHNGTRIYVILMGADSEGGEIAANRIIQAFNNICSDDAYNACYQMREIADELNNQ